MRSIEINVEMQNMSNSIELKIENKVAYITLNRPEVFNSFNREMALRLQSILDDCESNSEVRAIVLTGNGKAFCRGWGAGRRLSAPFGAVDRDGFR